MKIVIDARTLSLSGFHGVNTVTRTLVERLGVLDKTGEYFFMLTEDAAVPDSPRIHKLILPDLFSDHHEKLTADLLEKIKPDIFHSTWYVPILSGPAKKILTVYDLIPEKYFYAKAEKWKKRLDLFRERLHRLDHCICISKATQMDLIREYPVNTDNTSVIYLASNFQRSNEKSIPSASPAYILATGNYTAENKNLKRLIEAFAEFKKSDSHSFHLMITGSKERLITAYQKLWNELGIEKWILLPGFLPKDKLRQVFCNARAFVYPSLTEGFGIPPLDALQSGVPVAASNSSCLPEILGQAALYFDPLDIENMASVIYKIIFNDDIRDDLILKGYERVSNFSWDKMVTETIEIYRTLCTQDIYKKPYQPIKKKGSSVKNFLMHDPCDIGHHLVYADVFTQWALEREFEVYYSCCDIRSSEYYHNYKENPRVHLIPYDMPGSDTRRFFVNNGPRHQTDHVKLLQNQLAPKVTLFLYGDYMWPEWDRMIAENEKYSYPTYMLLLRSNEAYYLGAKTKYSVSFENQLKENTLFEGIFILDEYQAEEKANYKNIYFLPDPFRIFKSNDQLSFHEEKIMNDLDIFLIKNEGKKLVLFLGSFVQRKNPLWLIELAAKRDDLFYIQLGEILCDYDKGNPFILKLEKEGRYFVSKEYIRQPLTDCFLNKNCLEFMLLPYDEHYGSSAVQLTAFYFNKPVLVPENGLMGRRVIDHGLGFTFRNKDQNDFEKSANKLIDCDKPGFYENINKFKFRFSRESIFKYIDKAMFNR